MGMHFSLLTGSRDRDKCRYSKSLLKSLSTNQEQETENGQAIRKQHKQGKARIKNQKTKTGIKTRIVMQQNTKAWSQLVTKTPSIYFTIK